jgi:hypothetical protein
MKSVAAGLWRAAALLEHATERGRMTRRAVTLTPLDGSPSIPTLAICGGCEESKTMDADNEVTSPEAPLWEAPTFIEIRMDAEIGSYQDDFDNDDWH